MISSSKGASVVGRLATVVGVNGKSTGATTLYSVPSGNTLVITDITVRVTAANTVTVPPILQVGVSGTYTEWLSTGTLTGATSATASFNLAEFVGTAARAMFTSGQVVAVNITTGATATTLTLAFDVIGYLI